MLWKWAEDYTDMSVAAAEQMRQAVDRNPCAVVVLPTGHSPQLAYRIFRDGILRDGVDISRVTFVKLDEWLGLDETDAATCEVFLRRELLEPLGVAENQFLHFDSMAANPEAECRRFQAAYRALPRIDLVILGIGKNGHLGLNEPSEHLLAAAHTVSLTDETKTHEMLTRTDLPVTRGITMGMGELFRGEKILLLASGTGKAHLLEALTDARITTQIPVTFLKLHPNCICLADRTAFFKTQD